MNNTIFICGYYFKQPTDTEECLEVIWSEGKSCRKCPLKECYRTGWLKSTVTKDNNRIVKNKLEILLRRKNGNEY